MVAPGSAAASGVATTGSTAAAQSGSMGWVIAALFAGIAAAALLALRSASRTGRGG